MKKCCIEWHVFVEMAAAELKNRAKVEKVHSNNRFKRYWRLEKFLSSLDKMIFGTATIAILGQVESLLQSNVSLATMGFTALAILLRIKILWWIWHCRNELNSANAGEYRYKTRNQK